MNAFQNLVFSEADAPDWAGVTSNAKAGTSQLWGFLSASGIKGEITSGKRNKDDNSWHNLGEAVDIYLGDENGNRLEPEDPRVQKVLDRAKSDGWQEVLYHDAGSGHHLHVGNYKASSQSSDGSYSLNGSFDRAADPYGARPPIIPSREPEPNTFWSRNKDRFLDAAFDSPLAGAMRIAWAGIDTFPGDSYENWKPTQDDLDYVTKALPGDVEAQRWVLANANNPYHLSKMVSMKLEDQARRERIEAFRDGFTRVNLPFLGETNMTPAGLLSTLAGSVLSDPSILIPLGQEAIFARSLARLGRVGEALSTNKLVRYSELAATNAALNVGERYAAEVYGGYKQDYTAAAIVGGIAGAGLRMVGDVISNRSASRFIGAIDNAESHAIAQAAGAELPNAIPKVREDLLKLHDAALAKELKSNSLAKLAEDGKVVLAGRKELQDVFERWGFKLPDNVKAFHKADEGLTVLIKDAIGKETNIDNLIAHEVGVHGNLKETLGDRDYAALQTEVERRMKKPNADWQAAMKAAGDGGGWEEVLGHWIEKGNAKDSLLQQLQKGVNKTVKGLGGTANLTDLEVRDFVRRSVQNEVEKGKGFTTLPDGTVEMGGLRYSRNNLANPHIYENVLELEGIRKQGIGNWVSREMEAGRFYGTIQGTLANSVSPTARNFANDVLHDARMREYHGKMSMPAERQKDYIKRQLDLAYGKYLEIRKEHLGSTMQFHETAMQDFNFQVGEYYNATYSNNRAGLTVRQWDPSVIEAAKALKELRDMQVEFGKKSSDMFGAGKKNMIDPEWKPADQEIWRILDNDKWRTFVNKFPTEAAAKEWLTEYAIKAAKREKFKAAIMNEKIEAYKIEAGKAKVSEGPAPQRPTVTPDEVELRIREEAPKWAYGQINRDLSRIDAAEASIGDPHLIHERFPMDTSMIVKTPHGEDFSYDISLRSFDFDHIIPRVTNRFAGEIALMNHFGDAAALGEARKQLESDLRHAVAVQIKGYNASKAAREVDTFDLAVNELRGVRKPRDFQGVIGAAVQTAKNLSYAQNGANMGMNQIGEIGGAIAYMGGRTVWGMVPALRDAIMSMKYGKAGMEAFKEAQLELFGANLEHQLGMSSITSRTWKEANTSFGLARILDPANTLANAASQLVSKISLLPKLTDIMLKDARVNSIVDTYKWAQGQTFGAMRNPFSEKKLKAAGITQEMAASIRTDFLKYTLSNSEGMPTGFLLRQWEKEAPETYFKWRFLLDNQSMRAIQQSTIGNSNVLKDANAFTKIMFQFKDFSMRAMNGQFARVLTNREMDDCLSLLYSMASNMKVYAALTVGKAYAAYSNDPRKRQEYLDTRLAPDELALAAFWRSSVGSSLSPGRDLYEAVTGAQSYRTTVQRPYNANRQKERTGAQMLGDAIAQFPAVRTLQGIAIDTPEAIAHAVEGKLTQKDLREVARLFPLQNFLPMVYLTEAFLEESDLPKNPRKHR